MYRLILVSFLTTVLLSACGRKAVEPPPEMRPPKMPSSAPIQIPGLTIRCCRLGEQNVAVIVAKGEFPDHSGPDGVGLENSFWYAANWRQYSKEIELHWKCQVFPDLTGTIEFESWPGKFWPGEAFQMHIHKSDLTKGIIFVVRHKDSPKPLNALRIQKLERVAVGVPEDPRVAELSRIDVTQLVRPWRDLSIDRLTEAIASDKEIRSLTTIDGKSQVRPEQADQQPRPQ